MNLELPEAGAAFRFLFSSDTALSVLELTASLKVA
jgi:hypothetical protein